MSELPVEELTPPPVLQTAGEPSAHRYEFGALPAVGYDSDKGFALGGAASVARFAAGYLPYRWRLQAQAVITTREAPDDSLELPYQEYILKLDLPQLARDWLRLHFRLSYTRYTTLGYYGLGNASTYAPEVYEEAQRFYQYKRAYPQASVDGLVRLLPGFALITSLGYTYNQLEPYPESKLAQDLATDDPQLQRLLHGIGSHSNFMAGLGLLYDSRDDETAPADGALHDLTVRGSAGPELLYGGVNAAVRGYFPISGPRVVLALRLMGDFLWGDVPLYELARVGGISPEYAPGGGSAVRGVPIGRYSGKIKLIGNIELRSNLLTLQLNRQRFVLGTALFVDAGRVWTGIKSTPTLDGSSFQLKYGTGGGLRVRWGQSFLARVDLAWSPDAEPYGAYVNIQQVF